jgi:lantibiotic modifying enzyme
MSVGTARAEVTVTTGAAPELEGDLALLRTVVTSAAEYVLSTTRVDRVDRLWPADYSVFVTNPLSIAYGACGTALFLQRALGTIPTDVRRWLLERRLGTDTYPPGLFTGLAGIAHVFAELNELEAGAAALQLANRSPLRDAEPNLFQGTAGIGLVNLDFYRRTGDPAYLDVAAACGESLLRSSEIRGPFRSWPGTSSGHTAVGFAFGASGIASLLLRLAEATGSPQYRDAAIAAVEFDLSQAKPSYGDGLRWAAHTAEPGTRPYWLNGTAGVGTALVQLYRGTGETRYLTLAYQAARGASAIFTVSPEQFEGMSGIGEFLLDVYHATGDRTLLEAAYRTASSVLCYRIDRPGGTAFPGRQLARISTDFGTGAAGVGLFLYRLATGGARVLHDFHGPSVAC